ncbi:MAG: hypothetical protein EOL88_13120, partial [Bacteroidia bacterium]|nr:hypothetical protein [Bacteroidia bacterium]
MYKSTGLVWCIHPADEVIAKTISKLPGARYSKSRAQWYFKRSEFDLHQFYAALSPIAFIDYTDLKNSPKPVQLPLSKVTPAKEPVNIPEAYTDTLIRKQYSEQTKKTYTAYFADFMRYFKDRALDGITRDETN